MSAPWELVWTPRSIARIRPSTPMYTVHRLGRPRGPSTPYARATAVSGIAQNRDIDPRRRRERAIGVNRVAACRKNRGIECTQRTPGQPDRRAFSGAATGERLREPGDDHRRSSPEIRQTVGLPVRRRQREVRRDVSRCKLHPRATLIPAEQTPERRAQGGHRRRRRTPRVQRSPFLRGPLNTLRHSTHKTSAHRVLSLQTHGCDDLQFKKADPLHVSSAASLSSLDSGCSKLGMDEENSPTAPSTTLPAVGSSLIYSAVGASDVLGIGSSSPCFVFEDCNGTGYVWVAARQLRARGYTVTVGSLGIPGVGDQPHVSGSRGAEWADHRWQHPGTGDAVREPQREHRDGLHRRERREHDHGGARERSGRRRSQWLHRSEGRNVRERLRHADQRYPWTRHHRTRSSSSTCRTWPACRIWPAHRSRRSRPPSARRAHDDYRDQYTAGCHGDRSDVRLTDVPGPSTRRTGSTQTTPATPSSATRW